jgi:hypothetical protein
MSLLKERVSDFAGSKRLNLPSIATTFKLALGPDVAISSGEYGEIALSGPNLLDGNFLTLTINDTPYKVPLDPWTPEPLTFLRTAHLDAVNSLLAKVSSAPAAPTTTTRTLYLFGMSMATSWMQTGASGGDTKSVRSLGPAFPQQAALTGEHDTWNFSHRFGAALSANDAVIWQVHAITQLMPLFVPSYDPQPLLAKERELFKWTVEQQEAEVARVLSLGNWNAYKAAWDAYWAYRAADGFNTTAAVPPTVAEVPTIATPLVVTDNADPGGSNMWTPLKLASGNTQTYLGYNWMKVRSTCLTPEDEDAVKVVAAPYYPDETQRAAEVEEVKNLTAILTDNQKIIAELWAGGPLTTTPPGMFAWLWADYVARFIPAGYYSSAGEVNAQMLSFLHLGTNLFEGSCAIWGLKHDYLQCRPIQEIRHRYFGTDIDTWTGEQVPAGAWVPYQMSNFVTPPFADFPSGHSYFSKAFANTMTWWFGTDDINASALPVVERRITKAQLVQLSPIFTNTTTSSTTMEFGGFPVAAGGSEIQPDVVPATPITFSFSTWSEMATQVGMSRLYGGIHCTSAHSGSQAVANFLFPVILSKWEFTRE